MSLMQVLTRDNTFQSNTTPYAFFGSSYAGFPPSRTSITSSGSDVLAGSESEKQVRRSSDHKPGVEDSTKNTNMNNLQHVAQQSRREKLRIPGSLQQQPTSPHSEHSAPEIHETYTPNTNSDMLNSVYNNQMLTSELYSYTTGSELMNAVSGKAPGYMISDSLPPAPGLLGYSGQSVLPPKGGGSGTWSGQLGQFSNISVNPPSSTGISATLLVNSGLPGAFGSTTGRDLGSYFTGANPQEAMQLYLMNAGFGGYPEGGGSMVFPNAQIPIQNPVSNSVSSPVGFSNRPGYSGWKGSDSELVFMPASERAKQYNGQEPDFSESFTANQQALHVDAGAGSSQASGFQGLSLSLSSQQPPSLHALDVLHQSGLESPADGKRAKLTADLSHFRRDFSSGKIEAGANPSSTAMSASFNIISSSRYLKACQQLLEEVCSVGKGVKSEKGKKWSTPLTSPTSKEVPISAGAGNTTAKERSPESTKDGAGTNAATSTGTTSGGGTASGAGAATTASAAEGGESTSALSAEERQELESRKSKLVAMLQEVDRRYRQYYDQMQVVVSSFDAVAGVGAAMPYTALALQAMSRYFRCLKDAITGQISIVCKSLGEEDISKQITTKSPTSRLRFIDQQIRQQRAFQQLGMLNQHAWRPQRGLPERSVSILRAWLFEHFLHPYPKDADKMMLARQTGLTRSQVSNWFINARVRLWKPMVEEMYQEETREHELEAAANSRLHTDSEPGTGTEHPKHDTGSLNTQHTHMVAEYEASNNLGAASGSESNQFYEEASKKMRYDQGEHILSSMEMDMKHEDEHGNPLSFPGGTYDGNLRFPTNPGFRYNVNPTGSSGVSLTLGLQHSENLQQAYLHQGFHHGLAQRDNQGEHGFAGLYENAGGGGLHEGMNYTSRKHMESQLMHDFVPS